MNTLKKDIVFDGVGIHSGRSVQMRVSPSTKQGIHFYYDHQWIRVHINSIGMNHIRSTTLTNGKATIQTPEHFLAACYALKLTNISVSLNQTELPILDGSAIEFVTPLATELISIDGEDKEKIELKNDIQFRWKDSYYYGFPSNELIISVYLSYPDHWLKSMCYTYVHSKNAFINEIASARTYGFTHELAALKDQGLAKGGSLKNALVVSEEGYLNEPRFNDELARHKVLDFLGDMSILGKDLRGNFIIIRPSHQGNCEFLKQL